MASQAFPRIILDCGLHAYAEEAGAEPTQAEHEAGLREAFIAMLGAMELIKLGVFVERETIEKASESANALIREKVKELVKDISRKATLD